MPIQHFTIWMTWNWMFKWKYLYCVILCRYCVFTLEDISISSRTSVLLTSSRLYTFSKSVLSSLLFATKRINMAPCNMHEWWMTTLYPGNMISYNKLFSFCCCSSISVILLIMDVWSAPCNIKITSTQSYLFAGLVWIWQGQNHRFHLL